jgi:hypothetical protein
MILSENVVVIGSPCFYFSIPNGISHPEELKLLSLGFSSTLSINFQASVSYQSFAVRFARHGGVHK